MAITDLVPLPGDLNPGLTNAKQATMLVLLGSPRKNFTDECQPVTHVPLANLMRTISVGPFRATGIAPALESLRSIFEEVGVEQPAVHAALGSAGMLCARLVRGSQHAISNHAWGTAIDIVLNDILDRRGDNRVQQGLADIAPIFNRHGWFWGAGFSTEDAMLSRSATSSFARGVLMAYWDHRRSRRRGSSCWATAGRRSRTFSAP